MCSAKITEGGDERYLLNATWWFAFNGIVTFVSPYTYLLNLEGESEVGFW
ncbi:uncharacterized protein DS421_14g467750 [Arachis hypogaea]|nr:uncharacterized protein DS421_14g467750 [Arachis hypogaea]